MSSLKRRFTPLNLLMISINGTVGSAWLFAPLYAAKIAGPGALFAWMIAGLGTALIALSFAELSVLFPYAGGTAQIPRVSHGALTSYIVSWVAWLSALTMAPIEVQAILQYASIMFPSLMHIENSVPVLTGVGMVWATVLMLAFCIINTASFHGLVRFNNILFVFKILVIVLTIVLLIHTSFNTQNFLGPINGPMTFTAWQAVLTAVASGGVAFAFTGFKHGVELAGEAKNISFGVPLAIVGSIIVCLLLYLGLQVACIGALSPGSLSHGWPAISFVGDVGPFAGLAAGLGLFWLVKLLYIDAAVSPAGAGLIYVTSTARILYAMSQIGYLPKVLQKLNKQQFPYVAIMVNFVLGMVLFLPLPGWQAMVSFLVSGMVLSYAMGPIALLCLRLELPNKQRPFRLPAANLICPIAFYFCNLLSYWCGWETIYKLAIAMLIGLIFFGIACLRGQLQQGAGLKTGSWMLPYLGGTVAISYFGAFGGKGTIPFGWDFLIIGIFSLFILYLAVSNRAKVTETTLDQQFTAQSLTLVDAKE